ncbi:MAG: DUF2061 domain-containing protein [Crocinitomicaceae bacterium]|jgi:uncharacterized membrane protein|nr:DUF2061 domain-containing protein [Crocinitomicaceae bacterium]MDG1657991.1 DUF2061 domain-containing protein [Crocinitomicaceae bacterium]MDG2441574.1 DUF2061 domain-containing protein [Crocinitomicaceae bacterium]
MFIDAVKIKQLNDTKVSLLKTFTWRCLGTLDTMLISYLLTGKLDIALSIGGIEVVTKMLLYYLHERAWIKLLKR